MGELSQNKGEYETRSFGINARDALIINTTGVVVDLETRGVFCVVLAGLDGGGGFCLGA